MKKINSKKSWPTHPAVNWTSRRRYYLRFNKSLLWIKTIFCNASFPPFCRIFYIKNVFTCLNIVAPELQPGHRVNKFHLISRSLFSNATHMNHQIRQTLKKKSEIFEPPWNINHHFFVTNYSRTLDYQKKKLKLTPSISFFYTFSLVRPV